MQVTKRLAKLGQGVPRGWYVLGLAALSWVLVIGGWVSVKAGLAFLLG